MLDADYNAIEARIACWLGGETEALQDYVLGRDRYRAMAAKIFSVPENRVTSDQRDLGKQAILGLSYGMGMAKFSLSCEQRGITIDPALSEKAVKTFREAHRGIWKTWSTFDSLCRDALTNNMGTTIRLGKHGIRMAFKIQWLQGTKKKYLTITLPSGRKLAYLDPAIENGEITYWGQLPMSVAFGRIKLYGAKIFENVCQAIAADLMAHGARTAEAEFSRMPRARS